MSCHRPVSFRFTKIGFLPAQAFTNLRDPHYAAIVLKAGPAPPAQGTLLRRP
jgi:hypothetical protein